LPGQFAFTFGSGDEASRYNYKVYYNDRTHWWALNYLNAHDLVQYPNQRAGARAYAPSFPEGLFLGANADGPRISAGNEPPRSGTWHRGDLVVNASAAVGAPAFWQCTSSGSPGTWIPGPRLG